MWTCPYYFSTHGLGPPPHATIAQRFFAHSIKNPFSGSSSFTTSQHHPQIPSCWCSKTGAFHTQEKQTQKKKTPPPSSLRSVVLTQPPKFTHGSPSLLPKSRLPQTLTLLPWPKSELKKANQKKTEKKSFTVGNQILTKSFFLRQIKPTRKQRAMWATKSPHKNHQKNLKQGRKITAKVRLSQHTHTRAHKKLWCAKDTKLPSQQQHRRDDKDDNHAVAARFSNEP